MPAIQTPAHRGAAWRTAAAQASGGYQGPDGTAGAGPGALVIRIAAPPDAARLCQMVAALAAQHGDVAALDMAVLDRDVFVPRPWLYVLVAEAGDTLVGYAALAPRLQLQFGRRGLDLHHLYVDEARRGAGIGAALVRASAARARAMDCRVLTVGTAPENHRAGAFYLARGFRRLEAFPPRYAMDLPG